MSARRARTFRIYGILSCRVFLFEKCAKNQQASSLVVSVGEVRRNISVRVYDSDVRKEGANLLFEKCAKNQTGEQSCSFCWRSAPKYFCPCIDWLSVGEVRRNISVRVSIGFLLKEVRPYRLAFRSRSAPKKQSVGVAGGVRRSGAPKEPATFTNQF